MPCRCVDSRDSDRQDSLDSQLFTPRHRTPQPINQLVPRIILASSLQISAQLVALAQSQGNRQPFRFETSCSRYRALHALRSLLPVTAGTFEGTQVTRTQTAASIS